MDAHTLSHCRSPASSSNVSTATVGRAPLTLTTAALVKEKKDTVGMSVTRQYRWALGCSHPEPMVFVQAADTWWRVWKEERLND